MAKLCWQKINDGHNAWRVIESRRRDRTSRYHDDDDSDRFPAFTSNITDKSYPKEFKPVGIPKYDGSMIRAGTRPDLSQVKQEMNETLRSYNRCFFETHATIGNITDEDVIRCFQNGLFLKHTYHDFGRNRPTTAGELRDMMARWADQEDEENNRFPKRNHDKQSNGNGHFDKSQWNHSRNTRKCKPDQEVTAVERNLRGKKSGNNDLEFEKVMHKQCPVHPKSRHTLFECVIIRKSFNAPPLPQAGKRKDKEDDEEGDKSGAQDFPDPKNVVNTWQQCRGARGCGADGSRAGVICSATPVDGNMSSRDRRRHWLGFQFPAASRAGEEREGGLGARPSSASSCIGDGVRRKMEGRAQAGGDAGEGNGGAGCRRREGSRGCAACRRNRLEWGLVSQIFMVRNVLARCGKHAKEKEPSCNTWTRSRPAVGGWQVGTGSKARRALMGKRQQL
ncbi:retrotransposon protein, putative, Ty3-gypsy sub-class [Panicum miliaceum]|uniref:Retrotransposon protein, putative, Ty3-gypsy sub-class n=1 Tax=Panicum miliaceum TaxID=4540 RepID=A0A3L6PGW3_PANMI|nr:retrotransposon protein, putative, Ty3-gypsy sub-class [Panicum miliaceum]